MTTHDSEIENDPLFDLIVDAFDQQPIPPRPDAITTVDTARSDPSSVPQNWLVNRRGSRGLHLLAAIPAIAVSIALVVAFYRSGTDETALQPKGDIKSNVESGMESSLESVAQEQANTPEKQPVVAPPGVAPPPKAVEEKQLMPPLIGQHPRLAFAFEALGLWATGNSADLRKVAAYFAPHSTGVQDDIVAGLQATGNPRSVHKVSRAVDPSHRWCVGDQDTAFTFRLDFAALLLDADTFVNKLFGDEIFEPLLTGIMEDESGPKIDVRELIKSFANSAIFVVKPSDLAPLDGVLMAAIPLRDSADVQRALDKAMAVEPNAQKTRHSGFGLYIVTPHSQSDLKELGFEEQEPSEPALPFAVCVVNKTLILGERSMVLTALDRLRSKLKTP